MTPLLHCIPVFTAFRSSPTPRAVLLTNCIRQSKLMIRLLHCVQVLTAFRSSQAPPPPPPRAVLLVYCIRHSHTRHARRARQESNSHTPSLPSGGGIPG
eukprot:c19635_g1_i3 orf=88-384(-)